MKRIVIFAPFILFISGCASFSTFHTAETIPKGTCQLGLGISAGGISQKGDVASNPNVGYFTYPLPEINLRYGLLNSLDMGMRFAIGFGYGWEIDLKHSLLKQKTESHFPDLAIGVGRKGEYLMQGEDGDGDAAGTHNFVSLYCSKRTSKKIIPYSSYRIMWSNISIMDPSSGKTITENTKITMNGITLGICFDFRTKLLLEYGYYWSISRHGNNINNIGLSCFFQPKKLIREY